MTDLISRDELIHHLNECLADSDGKTPITDAVIVAIKCAVEQLPAIDAVPIVRCKDCRYDGACMTQSFSMESESVIPFDRSTFYCADGERRTDERKTD